ncbi:Zinc finger CCCH domain-containing protein 15-like protein [Operophtera brumata]|uniref:Zinc finger CCCH domain-containing protein 15-like protein n=1 Tax=Operophtera brumata TaxID=104452 RepID=A0A0L7LP05_OPEBR|nr:Zinc finger CCCH domain-containing protein 15-like protein [Operophtera brumata]
MPPKKAPAAAGASKKTETKKKEKVIEDKTFGLKNKKGAKQQKFIQHVEKQVKSGGIHPAKPVDDKKKLKEDKLKELKEMALLFKPVQTQKSVVCAFFKQGQCTKGDRCKFSHDLTIERKAEKRSLYVDMRDDGEEDNMANWDEEKLKEVVEKKHADEKSRPTTDIICKHFVDAVERSKYGWFWECPSGGKCIYRHALPPGFVLKRDKKKMEERKNEISLEQTSKAEDQRRTDYKAGRAVGLSGREMFSFDPALAADDDDDGDEAVDDSGTKAQSDRHERLVQDLPLDQVAGREGDGAGEDPATVPINENLFLDEELDEELENLDLED